MNYNRDYNQNHRSSYDISYFIGAYLNGGPLAPNIRGLVVFEPSMNGTKVYVSVSGLPEYTPASDTGDPVGPFGFHIHENGDCTLGNPESHFEAAGGHWNPTNQPHGNHAGDFPVIFSNDGYCEMSFYTNKFRPEDVVGKAVLIHQNPDDYRSQPSGNAGKRLACGAVGYIS